MTLSEAEFKGYLSEMFLDLSHLLDEAVHEKHARKFAQFLSRYQASRYAQDLPYRHRLSEGELQSWSAQLWDVCFKGRRSLQDGLQYFETFDTQSYPEAISQIGETLLARGQHRIYGVFYNSYGYCVHPHWFVKDFSYDDFFWFPPDLSWVLYAEGHGYLQAWGEHPVPSGIISW